MKAQRQGFRLEDVGNAPLAKRRRLKRDSLSRSSSSDSSRSSYSHGSLTPTKHLQTMSPMRNSPVRNLSNMSNASSTSQNSTLSQGFTPLKKSVTLGGGSDGGTTSGFFSFREARIAALTPTLTNSPEPGSSSCGDQQTQDLFSDQSTAAAEVSEGAGKVASKRKFEFSIQEIEDSDDDDADEDCVIVCEEQGFVLKTNSDTINNNSSTSSTSSAMRPRTGTIVIE